jgi:putative polyhydroxyalkanoate system protein
MTWAGNPDAMGTQTTVSKISIRRTHTLPHARAVEAVNAMAARLRDEYAVNSRWEGSTLHFERMGLTGTLQLHLKQLTIEVHLGFIMAALRGSIASGIERHLDEEFAAKPLRAEQRGK